MGLIAPYPPPLVTLSRKFLRKDAEKEAHRIRASRAYVDVEVRGQAGSWRVEGRKRPLR